MYHNGWKTLKPLAHPLGANFQEYIAILKYRPFHRLYMQVKMIYYYQGLDSAGIDYGSNPLENYQTRTKDYGYKVGDGDKVRSFNINLLTSYEVKENLFFDLNLQQRAYRVASGGNPKTTVISVGVRWNIGRRNFDF